LKRLQCILAIVALSLMLTVPAFAAPKVALPQRDTWDADMVDSNITGYTGKGVYIAVLDTGLVPYWRDYFPVARIATHLGKGFVENVQVDPQTGELVYSGFVHETSWVGESLSTHATHVSSTIIGYNYYAPSDWLGGFPLAPVFVKGIAPDATIIPVKVLSDYVFPGYWEGKNIQFGTDKAVAAGIYYATDLKIQGYSPMIISMSLGGPEPTVEIEAAIDYAIDNGVIVVASAGNEGDAGMGWPGAYPQVISVGACGWKYEWYWPNALPHAPRFRLWWLQDNTYGYRDIPEPTPATDVYITDFSSRPNATLGQQLEDLDIVAPGSWVRGPMPGSGDGYARLPWWSNGLSWYYSRPGLTNFFYVGGTSMSAPHVSAVAAQMLEKNPTLTQAEVETIMKTTALPIPAATDYEYYDIVNATGHSAPGWYYLTWGVDAVGSGLIQAGAAVAAS